MLKGLTKEFGETGSETGFDMSSFALKGLKFRLCGLGVPGLVVQSCSVCLNSKARGGSDGYLG